MTLYEDLLRAAALDSERALIRITTSYEPAGGSAARIFPPTYPSGPRDEHPYVIETRLVDGQQREAALLDSVPSEANRAEEALLRAARESRTSLPLITIRHGDGVAITSLEAPHRYADAYLRDSTVEGVPFDKSDLGKAMLAASPADASGLFQHDPGSLVYGAWNSHRKGRTARFPRIYASEIVGWNPKVGKRKAGRMDPLNLQGAVIGDGESWEHQTSQTKASARKEKGARLSEIGHGNIAPNDAHGGVTIDGATRIATLSFAALDRLRFGTAPVDAQLACRAALAAYALLGDRLAFGGGSLWLRSGCELLVTEEKLAWLGRGAAETPFTLSTAEALLLFDEARDHAAAAGVAMSLREVTMTPGKALADAINFSLAKAEPEGD